MKRYFDAAESAAREVLLEELKPKLSSITDNNNTTATTTTATSGLSLDDHDLLEQLHTSRTAEINENDGVFQLTTIGSLPLKSPKRMVALQLANSNPAFRERFREKLEASGGVTYQISDLSKQSSGSNRKTQKNKNNNSNNMNYSSYLDFDGQSHYMIDPDSQYPATGQQQPLQHGGSGNITISSTSSAFFPELSPSGILHSMGGQHHHRSSSSGHNPSVTFSELPTPVLEYLTGMSDQMTTTTNEGNSKNKRGTKAKKEKAPRGRKNQVEDSPERMENSDIPSSMDVKKRGKKKINGNNNEDNEQLLPNEGKGARKRRKNSKYEDNDDEDEDFSGINTNDTSINTTANSTNGGSIIKRRRKGELQIMVDGGSGAGQNNYSALHSSSNTNTKYANGLHSLAGGVLSAMGPPDDTPRRNLRLRGAQGLNSLGGPQAYSGYMESPFNPDMFSVFIDTPSNLLHTDILSSKPNTGTAADAMRFDFDEVAAHFPSPRAGEQLKGASPSRWSGGSAASMHSGFFSFPDPTSTKAHNSTGLEDHDLFSKKGRKNKRDSAESAISTFSEMSAISGLAALSEDTGDIGFHKPVHYEDQRLSMEMRSPVGVASTSSSAHQYGVGAPSRPGKKEKDLSPSMLLDSPSLCDVGVGSALQDAAGGDEQVKPCLYH